MFWQYGLPSPISDVPRRNCHREENTKRSDHYNERYVIHGDKLVCFGIEATGALGTQGRGIPSSRRGGCWRLAARHRAAPLQHDGRHAVAKKALASR